jgi:hypothetical protein
LHYPFQCFFFIVHWIHRNEPVSFVVIVPGPKIVHLALGLALLAGELKRRAVGVHPLLLYAAVGIEQGGIDHGAGAVGDDARGVDLVGSVVIFGRSHWLVLGQQFAVIKILPLLVNFPHFNIFETGDQPFFQFNQIHFFKNGIF